MASINIAADSASISLLPRDCYPPSESDDESFVVLGESSDPSFNSDSDEPVETTTIQSALNVATSSLNLLESSSSTLPSLPRAENINVMQKSGCSTFTMNSAELNPDDIQQKVDNLVQENMELKELLHQNNLNMKIQYDTLKVWKEDVLKVHHSYKDKFQKMKTCVEELKAENSKLKVELEQLKSKQSEIEMSSLHNMQEFMLKSAQKKADELSDKCQRFVDENGELKKIQDDLMEALGRLNEELASDKFQIAQLKADKESLHKIVESSISVEGKNVEIAQVKELYNQIQEQLMASQMHIMELQQERSNDKAIILEQEEQIKTAKAEAVDKDTVNALHEQLKLYKADFDAERLSKESVKAEKEQIADDLRHLQRRNQQLLEEVERFRNNDFVHVERGSASAPPREQSPSSPRYLCPICSKKFRGVSQLEQHVDYCITQAM